MPNTSDGKETSSQNAEAGAYIAGMLVFALLCAPCLVGVSTTGNAPLLAIFAIALIAFVSWAYSHRLQSKKVSCFLAIMVALAFVQLIDCFAAHEISAIRYMVFTLGIAVFVVSFCEGHLRLSNDAAMLLGTATIYICVAKSIFGASSLLYENTASGIMLFAYMICLIAFLSERRNRGRDFLFVDWRFATVLFGGVALLVGLEISKARTAMLTFLAILIIYFLLDRVICLRGKTLRRSYFFFVLFIITAVIVYANIRQFDWYDNLNQYSNLLFDKNIDSSRSGIWKQGLTSLEDNLILGAGADTLPTGIYEGRSYHSSYIQILVQNGMVGLLLLVAALYQLWSILSDNANEKVSCFSIAVFAGVLIYNCFECTLLSNKVALGLVQWLAIAIACQRATALKQAGERSQQRLGTSHDPKSRKTIT